MNKSKFWLISAAVLTLLGITIFAGVMTMNKWNFRILSTVQFEEKAYEITENFENISVKVGSASLEILPSADDAVKVICNQKIKVPYTVKTLDGTLFIEENDQRKWYDYIEIASFGKAKISVYLPKSEYGSLFVSGTTGDTEIAEGFTFKAANIALTTGDISLKSLTAESLDLSLTTGDVTADNVTVANDLNLKVSTGKSELCNIRCNNFISRGTTGKVTLKNLVALSKLDIKHTTCDVNLDSCDAAEIYIKVTTGDITASLLSGKTFIPKTTTGKITLPEKPEHLTGGRCELKATTGSINITVK